LRISVRASRVIGLSRRWGGRQRRRFIQV